MLKIVFDVLLLIGAFTLGVLGFKFLNKNDKLDKKELDDRVNKIKEDTENDLRKKDPSTIINTLDNKSDVFKTIDNGRSRFADRIRDLLQRRSKKSTDGSDKNSEWRNRYYITRSC